jgi:hypothetical protein
MPTMELEPMELPTDVTNARLEHLHRHADRVRRPVLHPPIPHYADSPDAEIRTTAISEVT